MMGWTYFGTAWSISTNPQTSIPDKWIAGTYIHYWGGAHVLGAVGVGILAYQAVAPIAAAISGAAGVNQACGGDMCGSEAQQIQNALQALEKSGVRPGQTEISLSRVMEIAEDFDITRASSSIYKASDGVRYLVEGHHTTVAATIVGRSGPFMGQLTKLAPEAMNIYWTRQTWEIWKEVIKVVP